MQHDCVYTIRLCIFLHHRVAMTQSSDTRRIYTISYVDLAQSSRTYTIIYCVCATRLCHLRSIVQKMHNRVAMTQSSRTHTINYCVSATRLCFLNLDLELMMIYDCERAVFQSVFILVWLKTICHCWSFTQQYLRLSTYLLSNVKYLLGTLWYVHTFNLPPWLHPALLHPKSKSTQSHRCTSYGSIHLCSGWSSPAQNPPLPSLTAVSTYSPSRRPISSSATVCSQQWVTATAAPPGNGRRRPSRRWMTYTGSARASKTEPVRTLQRLPSKIVDSVPFLAPVWR